MFCLPDGEADTAEVSQEEEEGGDDPWQQPPATALRGSDDQTDAAHQVHDQLVGTNSVKKLLRLVN